MTQIIHASTLYVDEKQNDWFNENNLAIAADIDLTANVWDESIFIQPASVNKTQSWEFFARLTIESVGLSLNMIAEAQLVEKTSALVVVATHDKSKASNAAIAVMKNVLQLAICHTVSVSANNSNKLCLKVQTNQGAKLLKDYSFFKARLVK